MTQPGNHDIRAAFGTAVRRLRTAKGLSQERLAELSEIHRTYIGDVERGTRNIALLNIERIAKALEIPSSRLFREVEAVQQEVPRRSRQP